MSACDYQSHFGHVPCHEVDRAISEAAAEFHVDELYMRGIVRCESRFNPYANARGRYKGLFQQAQQYWPQRAADFNARHNPNVEGIIYHPFDNSRVSARMLAAGMHRHWPNCP